MSDPKTRVVGEGTAAPQLTIPGVQLTVVEGPDRGRELVAKRGTVRVGSASDNDLALTDTSVSRRHLELRLRGDEVFVHDLGSTNGTTVDGVVVIEAKLTGGSLLRLGDTAIRVTPAAEPVVIPISARTEYGRLIGKSVAMRQVFGVLERVAPSEATVLVQGETGTGKELVAEAIHEGSARAEGPLVVFDSGAVTPTLIESALFGHVRGAFTGAVGDRRGAFEEAHGGTLFLDEIGELPLDLQPKLLRALENREVRRVGETRGRSVDVRVIAATNRNLAAEVNRGTFREDLYFRLAVVEVHVPPLRARREDIPLLVERFVRMLAPSSELPSPEIMRAFSARAWPGNVRELRNAVERALALSGARSGTPSATASAQETAGMHPSLDELLDVPYKEALDRWTQLFERRWLEHTLEKSGGSVSGAAKLAEVSRKHVQRLMKRYGIGRTDGSDS